MDFYQTLLEGRKVVYLKLINKKKEKRVFDLENLKFIQVQKMSLEIKSCVLYSWDFLTELVWGLPVSLRSQEKYQSNNFRGCFSIKPYWNKTQMSNSLFSTHTFYFQNLFFCKTLFRELSCWVPLLYCNNKIISNY